MDDVRAAKSQARSLVRARRREFVAAQRQGERAEQGAALATAFLTWVREYAAHLGQSDPSGLRITAFAPLPTEPPVGPLVQDALEAGMTVLLPVTVAGSHTLGWRLATAASGDGVLEDILGGAELDGQELGPQELLGTDIALIPGLAVDGVGHRLGQGGGYYDRALPLLRPGVPIIVALHDHEVPTDAGEGTVPHAPHDILVDGVLTTTGVRWLPQQ